MREKFNVLKVYREGLVEYGIVISKGDNKIAISDVAMLEHEKDRKKHFTDYMSGEIYIDVTKSTVVKKTKDKKRKIHTFNRTKPPIPGLKSVQGEILQIDKKDKKIVLDCGFIFNVVLGNEPKKSWWRRFFKSSYKKGEYLYLKNFLSEIKNLKKETKDRPKFIRNTGENPQPNGKIVNFTYWDLVKRKDKS
ncbi:hypothetical protein GF336_03305 [Candidatus Woesearchaeota archaeon]|nr:hypothetical protein [Candidatus Woesearchaeota archaeon]